MKGIFEGVKVLDLTWVIVGPRSTRYLADQGATVIKIENADHPCILRQSPPFKEGKSGINRSSYFAAFNTNKLSLGVNIEHPEGIELVKKLVVWADVVAESFVPGVMEKLGLGYEALKQIKPDIIFLRTNMLGATGPRATVRGYGFQLTGYAGLTHVTGWPDRTTIPPYGPYTDCIAPRFAAAALTLALLYRKNTGKGACIDISQHETGLQFLAPLLLDYQVNDRVKGREGNSDPYSCPHSVYPCKGTERWIAISVTNDEEWGAFSGMVGSEWIRDRKFASLQGRKENEKEINSLIAGWTVNYTTEALLAMLQERGIPAGMVKNGQDIIDDPQLSHRQAIWYLEHDDVGRHAVFGQGFTLSKNPVPSPVVAPHLGEHTFYVCQEILKMPDEEIVRLLERGTLQTVV